MPCLSCELYAPLVKAASLERRWQKASMRRAAASTALSSAQNDTRMMFCTPIAVPGRTNTFSSSTNRIANSRSCSTSSLVGSISIVANMAPWAARTLRPGQFLSLPQSSSLRSCRVSRSVSLQSARPGVAGSKRVGIAACGRLLVP